MMVIIIIVVQISVSLVIASYLPEDVKIPSHWNIKGEVDGYCGKWTGLILFPAINIGMLILMMAMPFYSVRYKNAEERFKKLIPDFTLILILFFAIIHLFSLLLAANIIPPNIKPMMIIMGLMFILLGNLLPKVPSNFYLGIRTPWTLSSENIWRKTHRLGGICFVLGGIFMIIIPIIVPVTSIGNTVAFIVFMIFIFIPVIYSFVLFKKEK